MTDPGATAAASQTVELILRAEQAQHEVLIAVLEGLGFERFWQEERRLRAYIPAAHWDEATRQQTGDALRAREVEEPFVARPMEEKNWNAVWEKGLVPVTAGPFLITPTWADAPAAHDLRFVLEIDPKMSFGTGHHESTRLALRLLAGLGSDSNALQGRRVLDAGTGTGVLVIAAVRLGAASAVAFDTDTHVLENATENLERNGAADRVALRVGTLEAVPETGFDLIFANINRNVLSKMMPAFREKLAPGGHAILAGLFVSDRGALLKRAAACGLLLEEEEAENEWWAVRLRVEEGAAEK